MSIRARVYHLLNGIVLLSFLIAPLQPPAQSPWPPGDQVRAAPAAGEQALSAVESTNTQPTPESLPASPEPAGRDGISPYDASPSTGLFRTTVTVRMPGDWVRLEKLGVVILSRGAEEQGSWGEFTSASLHPGTSAQTVVVLVDADQLEALALLRFEPRGTDELGALVAAHTTDKL